MFVATPLVTLDGHEIKQWLRPPWVFVPIVDVPLGVEYGVNLRA